jgi:uncharacterized membrane protein
MNDRRENWRVGLRWVLAAGYFGVGVIHLRSPGAFLPIVPEWVPMRRETILFTGVCEIAGAIGLCIPALRWWAGVMLAVYAVCVFPANINHALQGIVLAGKQLGWEYHAPRLAFQPVIVWWCLFAGSVIDWPWRRAAILERH